MKEPFLCILFRTIIRKVDVSITVVHFNEQKWKDILKWNTHDLQMCTVQSWPTFLAIMFS
jgi:hypothetical protein